jgi:ADP-ribosyl-[dinitrogen reductase] hydrolase
MTHGAPECLDACRLLAAIICRALSGESKKDILFGETSFRGEPKILAIARGEYREKSIEQIRGGGYVVESLEAALWCFLQTESFEAAILKSANLGDDADTTAAICGQVAGAFYGQTGIPRKMAGQAGYAPRNHGNF